MSIFTWIIVKIIWQYHAYFHKIRKLWPLVPEVVVSGWGGDTGKKKFKEYMYYLYSGWGRNTCVYIYIYTYIYIYI